MRKPLNHSTKIEPIFIRPCLKMGKYREISWKKREKAKK
ncbi:hypothetical protein HPHPH1_0996 [Helicobacter pylori Hp H-1]|uniref:Uncharacterized protein n=1 Tax=Helicobacter pylori Hp H-1 TaxID=992058 RepID=M7SL36_HELPX|nr:hypothetical protein HPHPH1_0996 [Helicobacter pylori Hp H-1]